MDNMNNDPEMQQMLARQELFENMSRIQKVCWDKCMTEGVDSYLSPKQEKCLEYCTDRFVDAIVIGTSRINQRLSGGSR
ncbi:unnamed protein product [Brachionus calyciflorus]|uniref:Mitochondrial import inner membrane translocase subunit n=1 Tax=Brachionus calyciflorus TaxID=104777 RepID=A0A813RE98_9BILA|nr:unnamed protein product [Brachionus calyciflorus]